MFNTLKTLWKKFKDWLHKFTTRNTIDARNTINARMESIAAVKNEEIIEEIKEINEEIAIIESQIELNKKTLREMTLYVKSLKSRLSSPNFLETNKFSPQWKIRPGGVYYYQLPNHKIIAEYTKGVVTFNPEGITHASK